MKETERIQQVERARGIAQQVIDTRAKDIFPSEQPLVGSRMDQLNYYHLLGTQRKDFVEETQQIVLPRLEELQIAGTFRSLAGLIEEGYFSAEEQADLHAIATNTRTPLPPQIQENENEVSIQINEEELAEITSLPEQAVPAFLHEVDQEAPEDTSQHEKIATPSEETEPVFPKLYLNPNEQAVVEYLATNSTRKKSYSPEDIRDVVFKDEIKNGVLTESSALVRVKRALTKIEKEPRGGYILKNFGTETHPFYYTEYNPELAESQEQIYVKPTDKKPAQKEQVEIPQLSKYPEADFIYRQGSINHKIYASALRFYKKGITFSLQELAEDIGIDYAKIRTNAYALFASSRHKGIVFVNTNTKRGPGEVGRYTLKDLGDREISQKQEAQKEEPPHSLDEDPSEETAENSEAIPQVIQKDTETQIAPPTEKIRLSNGQATVIRKLLKSSEKSTVLFTTVVKEVGDGRTRDKDWENTQIHINAINALLAGTGIEIKSPLLPNGQPNTAIVYLDAPKGINVEDIFDLQPPRQDRNSRFTTTLRPDREVTINQTPVTSEAESIINGQREQKKEVPMLSVYPNKNEFHIKGHTYRISYGRQMEILRTIFDNPSATYQQSDFVGNRQINTQELHLVDRNFRAIIDMISDVDPELAKLFEIGGTRLRPEYRFLGNIQFEE